MPAKPRTGSSTGPATGCGHWTQQERAHEVNAAMLDFLKTL